METNLENVVRELIEFIEENNICDMQNIAWLTDEDCYIESERSAEMAEILQKVQDALGDE
jgi:hypothetical protein